MRTAAAFELYLQLISVTAKPSSIFFYRESAKTFLDRYGRKRIQTIKHKHIVEYINYLKSTRGNSTNGVIMRVRNLARFFRVCIDEGFIQINPVDWRHLPRMIYAPPHKTPFTYEQYQRVLREVSRPRYEFDHTGQSFWRHAVILAWHTGMRFGDCCLLPWSGVNFDEQTITVFPKKMERHNQRLFIPIEPDLHEHLLETWNRRVSLQNADFADRVFPPLAWRYTTMRTDMAAYFRKVMLRVGLPHHSFHSFRHGFVTRLLNAGVDSLTVASMTGHSIEQLQTYAHVSMEAKVAALEHCRHALHQAKLKQLGFGREEAVR